MICDRRKYSAVIPDRERRTDFHRVLRSVYFLRRFGLFKEMNSSLVAIVSDQVWGLFQAHDRALVVGVSRKSFLGRLIGSPEISDRLIPGLVLTSLLRARGADVFRVHDVRENVYALQVTEAILQRAK